MAITLSSPPSKVLRFGGRPARNAVKTHCSQGHPLSGENLRIKHIKRTGRIERKCRICLRAEKFRSRKSIQAKLHGYLKTHPCVDCGEDDYVVLEFDHVIGEKEFNLSMGWLRSWERLQKEIAKCIVRCANCHKRRHTLDGSLGRNKWPR